MKILIWENKTILKHKDCKNWIYEITKCELTKFVNLQNCETKKTMQLLNYEITKLWNKKMWNYKNCEIAKF